MMCALPHGKANLARWQLFAAANCRHNHGVLLNQHCLRLGPSVQVGESDGAASQGFVGETRPPMRHAFGDVELGVKVGQVLLHRRFTHDQLGGYFSDRGRFGEQVTIEQRAAKQREDVVFARGDGRTLLRCLGGGMTNVNGVAEQQARSADAYLVAMPHAALAPDALAVEVRPVGRVKIRHAPARREPFEYRVQPADSRVLVDDEVVLRVLPDRNPVVVELDLASSAERPDLQPGVHAVSVRQR